MTKVHVFSSARDPVAAGSTELPPGWPTDGVARWVRMVGPPGPELLRALGALDLPEDVLETLRGDDTRARVVVCRGVASVIMPVLVPGNARVGVVRLVHVPTALITLEAQALPAIDAVAAELHHREPTASALPGLFLDVVQAAVTAAGPTYLSLRRRIDDLAEAVEDRPFDVPAEALITFKREAASPSAMWEDPSYCFLELQRRLARLPVFDAYRDRLRDMVADTDRGIKLLARLEDRLAALRGHHQHCLQEQTNRRLNMLAILSAIYMPATLIAGIYGMNFEHIPITEVPYGYLIVMSLMAVVVVGQLWYFSRRGRFK